MFRYFGFLRPIRRQNERNYRRKKNREGRKTHVTFTLLLKGVNNNIIRDAFQCVYVN